LVPLCVCLFFVFFGQNIKLMFQMAVGAMAFFAPIAWNAVGHHVTGCGFKLRGEDMDVSCVDQAEGEDSVKAMEFGMVVLAFVVGGQAMYTCRQWITFGQVVQGFFIGFIVCFWVIDMLAGGVSQQNQTTGWLEFGIIVLFGSGFAV